MWQSNSKKSRFWTEETEGDSSLNSFSGVNFSLFTFTLTVFFFLKDLFELLKNVLKSSFCLTFSYLLYNLDRFYLFSFVFEKYAYCFVNYYISIIFFIHQNPNIISLRFKKVGLCHSLSKQRRNDVGFL